MKFKPNPRFLSVVPQFIYTVFTIPLELRPKFFDPKKVRELRGGLWKMLQKEYGALFGFEATHPIAEEHPETFHPHLNFLWTQKPGHRPFIDVERLRGKYQKILGYHSTVNLYSQYSNKIPQIWKWCQYITRVFPSLAKWCGPSKWYGKYPKSDQKESCICPECNTKIYTLGYVDSYAYESYSRYGWKVGTDPPWLND
ncbi:unnamed protein product, partial [marine sediment metagenome]